ncbi:MAG: nitroreductase family protein [Exilibacterium sp.]
MVYEDTLYADFSRRDADKKVDDTLVKRWSPRAFKKVAISEADIQTLFDAPRWSPSSYNEQPWRFYVSSDETFNDYLELLVPANQKWAKNASLLCFVVCKTTFTANGKPNGCAEFDTGAAWMALAYQSRKMGLYTHGMAGIKYEEVAQYLRLQGDEKVLCAIAIGVADVPDSLPDELAEKEVPSGRKKLEEILKR